ncbi:MAG: right-handed parallel beta-helix repeat-containing protein [Bacteroidota bacterium]
MLTKKNISFYMVLLFGLHARSQTNISGTINTNTIWTKLNSPYIVTANTVLLPNVVLDIQPGVEVRFNSNVQLMIRGILTGKGNKNDSIKFVANNGVVQWNGVFVDNSSYNAKVSFKYFLGSNAYSLFKVASVGSNDTLMKFLNCSFNYNHSVFEEYDGVKTHMVYVDSCLFANTSYYCNIGASNNIIKNSKFTGNSYRALYNNTTQNTVIDNCEFTGFSDAALLVNGIITNSKFHNNYIAVATMSDNSPVITGNSFYDNNIGIHAWNYFGVNPSTQINYNEFCNNTYAIKKVYSVDTSVPNNCWCTTDNSQIDATIYDFFDAPSLGIVNYLPKSSGCPIPASVNEIDFSDRINVFPNPTKNGIYIGFKQLNFNDVDIELINPIGEFLTPNFSELVADDNLFLNMTSLASGIYYLQIAVGNKKIMKKVVKL